MALEAPQATMGRKGVDHDSEAAADLRGKPQSPTGDRGLT